MDDMREYMIYCDESLSKGTYYSHFYGGVLVRSKDFHQVNTALEEMKTQLNLFGEIKWTKVTAPYLEKYKRMMDVFFGFVKDKKLKMRVMFQETSQIVPNHGAALQYHLLYYQFIKHAFGLAYHKNNPVRPTKIKLFFDEIPDTREQNDDFKAHLNYLQELSLFHNAKIVLKPWDIAEIDSHKHPIQQCMDIVLGAMAFHMNKMHLPASEGGPGTPGKKTQAKEELFQYILTLIKDANGDADFNIYENTCPETGRGRWRVPYRHWKFVPAEFREKKA